MEEECKFVKKIETYKLPFFERVARCYPFVKFIIVALLTIIIALPILIIHKFESRYFLFLSPLIFPFFISSWNFGLWIYANKKYKNWYFKEANCSQNVQMDYGPPGACKTLETMFKANAQAESSWFKAQYEMWKILKKINDKTFVPNDDEKEVIESYEFYIKNNGIPCLASNIKVYSKIYRRYSYDFEYEHLSQIKRAPYRLCAVIDEAGALLPTELFRDRDSNKLRTLQIEDTFRFCRQFNEMRLNGSEQRVGNVFKSVRGVVGVSKIFYDKEFVLKPRFLTWIFEKLKNRFTNRMSYNDSVKYADFMAKFERFINNIGFFKISYIYMGNLENGNVTSLPGLDKVQKLYLPCCFDFIYNTRAYRGGYDCLNNPIEMSCRETIDLDSELLKTYMRSSKIIKSKEEKEIKKNKKSDLNLEKQEENNTKSEQKKELNSVEKKVAIDEKEKKNEELLKF